MMTNFKTTLIVPALMTFGMFGLASEAKANPWEAIDSLSLRLRATSEILHEEARDHFQQTPVYQGFDRRVCEMGKRAAHIHTLATSTQCPRELSNDLRQLNLLHREARYLLEQMRQWNHLHPVAYQNLCESMEDVGVTLRTLRGLLLQLELGVPSQQAPPHNVGYPPVGQPTGFPNGFEPQPRPNVRPVIAPAPSCRGSGPIRIGYYR